jgi:hypothetical protein
MRLAPLPTAVNFLRVGGGGTCKYKSNHTSNSFEGPSYVAVIVRTWTCPRTASALPRTLTQYITCDMLPVTTQQNSGLKQKFQASEPCLEHASHHLSCCYMKNILRFAIYLYLRLEWFTKLWKLNASPGIAKSSPSLPRHIVSAEHKTPSAKKFSNHN